MTILVNTVVSERCPPVDRGSISESPDLTADQSYEEGKRATDNWPLDDAEGDR